MCGRARCTLRPHDVARACGINNPSSLPVHHSDRYRPSFNVSPGFYLPVLRRDEGPSDGLAVHCMKWGLVPSFTKKSEKPDHFRMFNARSESIGEKASFRRLVPHHRCLVAVEGFYEWKKDGSKKQPYYIHFNGDRPLVFAALYDSWKNSEGEILYTLTILTTRCSLSLQWLHDRMPVILGRQSDIDLWLHGPPSTNFDNVLVPYEDADLVWYPVTPQMGKISFDGPDCVEEIKLKSEESSPISKFFSRKTPETKQDLGQVIEDSSEKSFQTDDKIDQLKEEASAKEVLDSDVKTSFNDSYKPMTSDTNREEDISGEEKKSIDIKHDNKVGTVENSDPQVKSSFGESKLYETIKQEPSEREECKPKKYDSPCITDKKIGIKREHGEFATDINKLPKTTGGTQASSVKKTKLNKDSGSKQPTLHSFFGRN